MSSSRRLILHAELRRSAVAANGFIGRLSTAFLRGAADLEVRTALLGGACLVLAASRQSVPSVGRKPPERCDRMCPPYVAVDLLFGPLFYQMFVQHEPVTEAFVGQAFQNALEGLRRPTQGRQRRTAARRSRRRAR